MKGVDSLKNEINDVANKAVVANTDTDQITDDIIENDENNDENNDSDSDE